MYIYAYIIKVKHIYKLILYLKEITNFTQYRFRIYICNVFVDLSAYYIVKYMCRKREKLFQFNFLFLYTRLHF